MDEFLNQIAEDTGVPADLLERAARARAAAQGVDIDGLVAGWAGAPAVDSGQAPPAAAQPEPSVPATPQSDPTPAPQPEAAAPPAPAAPAPAAGLQLDEMFGQVSANTDVPVDLLERAARARANKAGVDVSALVAGWTGEEAAAPAATPPAPAAAPVAPAPTPGPAADTGAGQLPEALLRRSAAARAKREGRPLDEVLVEMGLSPEGETPAPAPAEAAPVPAAAQAEEAAEEEPVTEEPVAEEEPQSVFAGFPRWLAASFILIPMIALLYAGLSPHGPDCGQSGQLDINPLTGEAQGCAGDASPFFSLGQSIYSAQCTACHGAGGGGGVGPAFTGGAVLTTFSACSDHVEWVAIGTNDWPEATYGDTGKPAGGVGVMPGYQNSLSLEEIAAVSLYERVAFGGEDLAVAEESCGLLGGEEG